MIVVDYRKWRDLPHWRHEMELLGEDRFGTWLAGRPGALVAKGEEDPIPVDHDFIQLIADGQWWTPIFNAWGLHQVYVDVVTPPRREGNRITMIDLDLDVSRRFDGTVELLDEDEFEANLHLYPPEVAERARATALHLVEALRRGEEPFGTVGMGWLERLD